MSIDMVLLILLLVFLNHFSLFTFWLFLLILILLTTSGSLFADELVGLSLSHDLCFLGFCRRLLWWFCFLWIRLGDIFLFFNLSFGIIEASNLDILELISFLHFHELPFLEWTNIWDGWVRIYYLSTHEGACGFIGVVKVLFHGSRSDANIWGYFTLTLDQLLLIDGIWRNCHLISIDIFRFWGQ